MKPEDFFCFRKIARKYGPFISRQFEEQGYMNYQLDGFCSDPATFYEAHFHSEPHPALILDYLEVGQADTIDPRPDSDNQ